MVANSDAEEALGSEVEKEKMTQHEIKVKIGRAMSPLKRIGQPSEGRQDYMFLHKSFQEFFAAMEIFRQLVANQEADRDHQSAHRPQTEWDQKKEGAPKQLPAVACSDAHDALEHAGDRIDQGFIDTQNQSHRAAGNARDGVGGTHSHATGEGAHRPRSLRMGGCVFSVCGVV